jgi:predicted RND superfamily exporter protein
VVTHISVGDAQDHEEFDTGAGSPLERLIFNNRKWVLLFFVIVTALSGWSALKIRVNADFLSMLPQEQVFVRNYVNNAQDLRGLGDSIRIVVISKNGTIYNKNYLSALQKINDAVFLLPGVDRSFMKSLWMPLVSWIEITEQGEVGGPVMPDTYDGSQVSIAQLHQNVIKAGITGSLVANDQRSSIIFVPLLNRYGGTGAPFNYGQFWQQLQSTLQRLQTPGVEVHVVGFAAIMGTLIADLYQVIAFFTFAIILSFFFILAFTRCLRSSVLILFCSVVANIWLLGLIRVLGYALDPYSVLVPFLIFAIGVSHGAQKMNGIMQDVGRGAHKLVAARLTFRRLFMAGLTALMVDAVGFMVLNVIKIDAIRVLAITASLGVTILIFTNLVLLPVLLSYVSVSQAAARRSLSSLTAQGAGERGGGILDRIFIVLEHFTERRWALLAIGVTMILAGVGLAVGRNVQIGDVSAGAPEFRQDSEYNRSNAYVLAHYSLSSDQFAVVVKTAPNGLLAFPALIKIDRLEQQLRTLPGVQTTTSAADMVRTYTVGSFEGDLRWWTINRGNYLLSSSMNNVYVGNPELINPNYTTAPIIIYLKDHKAQTLTSVTNVVGQFAADNNDGDVRFLLAAGNAGLDEATNIVVSAANVYMPLLVYAAVAILCFISFRSWRAVVVAIVPLIVTSILCQALMVLLNIGIKVATLPVMALGVGIGVDYALYLLSVQLTYQRDGEPLRQAYHRALRFTGRIVAFVGFTLAVSVSLWVFSPIKFQEDMGILLTFMFLWNMLGALVLIPALSHFLLQTRWVVPRTMRAVENYGSQHCMDNV